MIKTKEDLHHTFIDGSCEELKKLLEKAKEFGLEVNPSAFKNTAIGVDLTLVNRANFYQVDHNGDNLNYYKDVLEYEELTLEDFEEDSKEESSTKETPKYQYTQVAIDSFFDLREMFEDGELYFEDANQGDDQGMVNIEDEGTLVILLADKDAIYTRKEITLQDKVEGFMKRVTTEGYWTADYSIRVENRQYHLIEGDFLEMCRVALRANEELK